MNHTKIEWVKNPDGSQGYTWNPITGCLGPKGDGVHCSYCYAKKLANGWLRQRYLANNNYVTWRNTAVDFYADQEKGGQFYKAEIDAPFDPFYPRFWPERLGDIPLKPPKGIFVCDMGELFGDWLPRDWQDRIFAIIKGNPQHRFYLLTKQPHLIKFSPFPENCWVGVTITNEDMLFDAADALNNIEASMKYLSIEPLLHWRNEAQGFSFGLSFINWLIIGGQSGRNKFYPPEPWIQEIEDACDKAGIPVFEKDNLRKTWDKLPRREIPK